MTKIINFFAGPGVGKSTCSCELFSIMKNQGINCEIVQEFAKELTWTRDPAIGCQMYVTGTQMWRTLRLVGEVDYIITDSPILTGCFYNSNEHLNEAILYDFHKMENINILLKRTKPYNPKGRTQTLEESDNIHIKIEEFLNVNNIPFHNYEGNSEGTKKIFEDLICQTT